MNEKNPTRKMYPQFARSPEPFPNLTTFPDGWELSDVLETTDQMASETDESTQLAEGEGHAQGENASR
jgi:hypothetical protein